MTGNVLVFFDREIEPEEVARRVGEVARHLGLGVAWRSENGSRGLCLNGGAETARESLCPELPTWDLAPLRLGGKTLDLLKSVPRLKGLLTPGEGHPSDPEADRNGDPRALARKVEEGSEALSGT